MNIRRMTAVAAIGVLAAGATVPALAAPPKKKPITKTYDLQLAPVWSDPQAACSDERLEGISIHTETIKPTGPGILSVKVNGHTGDWDIAVKDSADDEIAKGSGNDTPHTGPGEETAVVKFKKGQEIRIAVCNFLGTPEATATFTYKYT